MTDKGVTFVAEQNRKILLTPEKSIKFQFDLDPDMVVVLDEFTEPTATYEKAKETVERTLLWAKKSKEEYVRQCIVRGLDPSTMLGMTQPKAAHLGGQANGRGRPYLLAVVQGGEFLDLREYCAKELAKIGFDGFGYGGWPLREAQGKPGKWEFNYDVAKVIADNAPEDYLLYGLGIGKPEEIVGCVDLGYTIFDCVLPTRDARHGRLYVYDADSIDEINIRHEKFYSYYVPTKEKHFGDTNPVSNACDCLLCSKYSRGYLAHLFRSKEMTAMRLATIHNLRFYSLLMQKIQEEQAKS
jgi:queuine tRNA-ribosyltransferase